MIKNVEMYRKVDIQMFTTAGNISKIRECMIYVKEGDRLTDTLNDGRAFLPIFTPDRMTGEMKELRIININAISSIEEC